MLFCVLYLCVYYEYRSLSLCLSFLSDSYTPSYLYLFSSFWYGIPCFFSFFPLSFLNTCSNDSAWGHCSDAVKCWRVSWSSLLCLLSFSALQGKWRVSGWVEQRSWDSILVTLMLLHATVQWTSNKLYLIFHLRHIMESAFLSDPRSSKVSLGFL